MEWLSDISLLIFLCFLLTMMVELNGAKLVANQFHKFELMTIKKVFAVFSIEENNYKHFSKQFLRTIFPM